MSKESLPVVTMGVLLFGAIAATVAVNASNAKNQHDSLVQQTTAGVPTVPVNLSPKSTETVPKTEVTGSATSEAAKTLTLDQASKGDEVVLVFTGSHGSQTDAENALTALHERKTDDAFVTDSSHWPPLRPGYWLSVAGAFSDLNDAKTYGNHLSDELGYKVSVRTCKFQETTDREIAQESIKDVIRQGEEAQKAVRESVAKVKPADDFFTLGSSEDDVLRVQGTPESIHEYGGRKIFDYKYASSVTIEDGVVTDYRNSLDQLKIKILPRFPVVPSDYYTLGSTEDEVLYIQGTPESINRYGARTVFNYKYASSVTFKDGVVTDYKNSLDVLKIRILPKK